MNLAIIYRGYEKQWLISKDPFSCSEAQAAINNIKGIKANSN
jgi:hypothetical protein